MDARCTSNVVSRIQELDIARRLQKSIHREGPDDDLIIGAVYPVLALELWEDGGLRLYVHSVKERDYPYPYPIEMFEIIDLSLDVCWQIKFEKGEYGIIIKRISFPEWINDDHFYEKLIDGDEAVIAIYRQHKRITH